MPRIVAHRTCPRHAPENSLEGIHVAANLGADAVEVDVRVTADGVPVLMHDPSTLRTTGVRGGVRRRSWAEVGALTLSNGEAVPTLSDALAVLPAGLGIVLDVKDPAAIDSTLALLTGHGVAERARVWSQHVRVVATTRTRLPDLEAALLRDSRTRIGVSRFLRDAVRCRAHAISAHWDAVTPDLERRCRRLGLGLVAWCRDDAPEPAKAALLDDLVTDWPLESRVELHAGDGTR